MYVNNLLMLLTILASKTTPDNAQCSSAYFWTLKYISKFHQIDLAPFNDKVFNSYNLDIHHPSLQVRVGSIDLMSEHLHSIEQNESALKTHSHSIP